MKKLPKSRIISSIIAMFFLVILPATLSADTIELHKLLENSVSSQWSPGQTVKISSLAHGLKGDDYYFTFMDGTEFSLLTTGYSINDNNYAGSLNIESPDGSLNYFSADFTDLVVNYNFGLPGFKIETLTNLQGMLVPDATLPLNLTALGWPLVDGFTGQIRGLPSFETPEPGTFMLLALGLMAISGIARKRMTSI